MKKVIKYVEAMLERDLRDPEVTEATADANLDGRASDAVVEELKEWFERRGDVAARPIDEDLKDLADRIVGKLGDHIDVDVWGGHVKRDGNAGVALTPVGCNEPVERQLSNFGVIPFTEVAVLRLDDLKALIAERDELFARANAFRLDNLEAVLAKRDEMLGRVDAAAAVPA